MTAPAVLPVTPSQPGFLLWVGVDPQRRHHAQELVELAETLGELARELLPTAETFIALSLARARQGVEGHVDLASLQDRLAHLDVVEHVPAPRALPRFDDVPPRVKIDLAARRVLVEGVERHLTYKEFELLAHLVGAAGRTVPRGELYGSVWGPRDEGATSRTIDVHIRRLREKLGLVDQIVTVRGAGYLFQQSDDVVVTRAPVSA